MEIACVDAEVPRACRDAVVAVHEGWTDVGFVCSKSLVCAKRIRVSVGVCVCVFLCMCVWRIGRSECVNIFGCR